MYRTILVPLDGSDLAERVIPYVDYLARASGGRVVLLHAIQPPMLHTRDARQEQSQHINDAADYLARVAKCLDPVTNVQTVVASGEPDSVVAWESLTRGVDLVVMSTHGRSGLGRLVHGSVADAVMRHAPVPVLLIPAHCVAEQGWPTTRPLRVVVPLDGSGLARSALPAAVELAGRVGPEIHLTRVVPPVATTYTEGAIVLAYDQTEELIEAAHDVERTAESLRADGYRVGVHSAFGPAAQMIVETAGEVRADVIAMSTHGNGGVTRLVAGSVATSVIQHATVPVLVVRSGAHPHPLTATDSPSIHRVDSPVFP